MDSEEKKFKLDELPELGSGPEVHIAPIPKALKDPRLDKLLVLNHKDKVDVMKRKWRFDKKELTFGWLAFVLIILALHNINVHAIYIREMGAVVSPEGGIAIIVFRIATFLVDIILKQPLVFLLLTPFLFKLKKETEFYFEVTFDGISTLRKITLQEKEMPYRLFLKWPEITRIEKAKSGRRRILKVYSLEEKVAEMIWDFDEDNKRAVKILLNGLINPKHPLREFVEKDLK